MPDSTCIARQVFAAELSMSMDLAQIEPRREGDAVVVPRGTANLPWRDITSEAEYLSARQVALKSMGALTLGGMLGPSPKAMAQTSVAAALVEQNFARLAAPRNALYLPTEPLAPWSQVATYVLYHQFGEGAEAVMQKSWAMNIDPWTITVEGEVLKPKVFGLDELLTLSALEERIYRHRCVGGWVMTVPWMGYSLHELLRRAQPTGNAKFVEFTAHWDDKIMANAFYKFTYLESLRLDEALHPLTLLTFGHHGRVLPKQNGAPVRLITPWKFAHKSPKAIVKIRLTEKRPSAFLYDQYSHLYGWYRNVHPDLVQGARNAGKSALKNGFGGATHRCSMAMQNKLPRFTGRS